MELYCQQVAGQPTSGRVPPLPTTTWPPGPLGQDYAATRHAGWRLLCSHRLPQPFKKKKEREPPLCMRDRSTGKKTWEGQASCGHRKRLVCRGSRLVIGWTDLNGWTLGGTLQGCAAAFALSRTQQRMALVMWVLVSVVLASDMVRRSGTTLGSTPSAGSANWV